MHSIALDSIDHRILTLLQRNARVSVASLAAEVGLTATPLRQRIDKLERRGVIRGYHAAIDGAAVGRGTLAFVHVTLKDHTATRSRAFVALMNEAPEVTECHHISGDADFLLKVQVANMSDFELFLLRRLGAFDGIDRAKTAFVFSTSKHDGLPQARTGALHDD